jgi:cysteine desulfurase
MKNYFFDYASTTPVNEEILQKMFDFDQKYFANVSALYSLGQISHQFLMQAKDIFLESLSAQNHEVIFTSSATESNNLAIKGFALANKNKGNHILLNPIEHDSLIESANYLKSQGFEIEYLKIDEFGQVDLDDLVNKIRNETILVSIMAVNNEIGTLNDLEKIGQICQDKKVIFHSDLSQAYGKIKFNLEKINLDFATISSHKINGPKGVALLLKKKGLKLLPLLHGGGQENNFRSSTYNLTGIMGFAWAAEKINQNLKENQKKVKIIRDYFIEKVRKEIQHVKLNGHPEKRLVNNAHFSFVSIEGEALVLRLSNHNIFVSTGSACSSKKLQASHVLRAINLSPYYLHGSIRFSFSPDNTKKEIDYLVKNLKGEVEKLREISPFKFN